MKKYLSFFLLVALLAVSAGQVLAEDVVAKDQQLPSNIKELSHSGKSLKSIFDSGDGVITLETLRGNLTPEEMRAGDKDTPLYEIDIRLTDEDGTVFFVQTGGDTPIDTEWQASYDDNQNSLLKGDKVKKNPAKTFGAAGKMLKSLKKLKFKNDLLPEQAAIAGIIPIIESGLVTEKLTVELPSGSDSEFAVMASASSYIHTIEIRTKPIWWSLGLGEHSGTLAKFYNSSGILYTMWSACNHGTCPAAMTLKCRGTFYARYSMLSVVNCTTPYFAGPIVTGVHVCNDDTYIQYWKVKNNAQPSTTGGTCGDGTFRTKAPSCW